MANKPIENTNVEMSFLEEDSENDIQIKDILFIILRNLHWFILSGLIGAGIAYWKVNGEERIYTSSASIMIKTGAATGTESIRSSSVMNQMLGNGGVVSTVNNEIIILKSATLMDSVVRKLGLNVNCSYKTKVAKRNKALYQDSPVSFTFENLDENAYYAFTLTPKDSKHCIISDMGNNAQEKEVALGEKIITPIGEMVVSEKWNYNNLIDVPISVNIVPVSAMSASLRQRLFVERDDEKNSIIRLSINDNSASRAADILNILIAVYNNDAIADQERMLNYSYKFINGRIGQLYGDLDSLQEQIVDFKVANVLIDTKSLGQGELATRSASSAEVKVLQARISRTSYLLDVANSVADDEVLPVMSDMGTASSDLIAKYNENARKLLKFRESGVMENPTAKKLVSEQPKLLANIIAILESDISSLETQVKMAKNEGQAATSIIQTVPEKQVRIGLVEDMLEIRQQLYLTLLTKREEMLLERPKFEGTAKVIDAAKINNSPIAPNPKKRITTGLLIGLLIPAVVIILIRLLDTAIYTRADVEKKTKTPFLGEIPYKEEIAEHGLVIKENSRDAISEAFRIVRSNLEYMRINDKDRNKGQVLLFTSFMVSSGKTFVSSNLAYSFAFGNKKVALVDLDIRKGTLNKVFGQKSTHQGVSTYLSGKCDDVEEIIIHETGNDNLNVILSGPIPPNPAELLMNDRLDKLVDYLRERYDYVFLDNVPLGIVADADIVKRVADNTLFVLCAGKTDKRYLSDLDKLYRGNTFPNLSVILNSVKYKKRRGYGYGYGHGGGYGYGSYGGYGYGYGGYGYGYGYDDVEEEKSSLHRLLHRKHKSSEEKSEDKD